MVMWPTLCASSVYQQWCILAGVSPVYTLVGIQGKSPLQGNIRYISLAVPLIYIYTTMLAQKTKTLPSFSGDVFECLH